MNVRYAALALWCLGLTFGTSCTCPVGVTPTTNITYAHMDAVGAVVRATIRWPIKTGNTTSYTLVYTNTWYKDNIGLGHLVVKAQSHKSCAGAALINGQTYILFGFIKVESVPDYSGQLAVLTLDGCRPQKNVKTLVSPEWNTLLRYSPSPSAFPTQSPTVKPSATPTASPTVKPSATPTASPTVKPSATPTVSPTKAPTPSPTKAPTAAPTTRPPTRAPITSQPTAKPDPFDIQLDLAVKIPEADRKFFKVAVNRWKSVLTSGQRTFFNTTRLGAPPRGCTYPADIEDLYVCASYDLMKSDGPGGFVGFSIPLFWRTPSYIPFAGAISIDSADVSSLKTKGIYGRVVLHEMAHVLGIGTQWNRTRVTGQLSEGCPYFGPKANAEYKAVTGCAVVPTEQGGGAGTQCQHWDETCLGDELMTGFVGGRTQLSRITIGGLEDLGYNVNYANSDYLGPDDIHPNCMCTNRRRQQRQLFEPKHGEVRRLGEPNNNRRKLSDEAYDMAMDIGKEIVEKLFGQSAGVTNSKEFEGASSVSVLYEEDGLLYGVIVQYQPNDD